MTRADQKDLDS